MSEVNPAQQGPARLRVGEQIGPRVDRLQRSALEGVPAARAALAELRKAIGAEPGSVPAAWQWTQVSVPDNARDEPTWDEIAAHTAMALYAIHQQSRSEPMHRRGVGFGAAMRRLVYAGGTEENPAARSRFNTLITATTVAELQTHLRSVVRLLRQQSIPIDYGMLADDLAQFQRPGGSSTVRRRWARQFHRLVPTVITEEPEVKE